MANEATVGSYLQIQKNNLVYHSRPTVFQADIDGTEKGPVPGAITATPAGTDVDLSELTVPGLCRITNLDSTNLVMVGIWDPESVLFYPLMDILPGEHYVFRISHLLSLEMGTGTGTGTGGPSTNTLRIKASVANCNVVVEAFEK